MLTHDFKKIEKSFTGKHILSLDQFDSSSLQKLFRAVQTIKKNAGKNKYLDLLKGKVAAMLFFEPSSRTFSSFAAAMKRLGGQTIEYQNPLQTSSAVKGETLGDTAQVFGAYADVIIMRHFTQGAAQEAAFFSPVPVINAGDGIGEHPTQALLDMVTLHERFGTLDGIRGVMVGDLLNGRTIHSLMKGLSYFKNVKLYLLSPKQLKLDSAFVAQQRKNGLSIVEIESEKDMPKDAHFWYWTRVQKERFSDIKEYEKVKHTFIVTPKLLKEKGNNNMILMHPLPRVGEIETAVDADPRAVYLNIQIKNGMYTRMALLSLVLGKI